MNTRIVVCPLGLFGSPGTQAGAELVADALRELLDDNADETGRTGHGRLPRPRRIPRVGVRHARRPCRLAGHGAAGRRRGRLRAGDFLVWVGGNHLSLLPVYEELADGGTLVVQFDAHLDLYNLHDTRPELTHGNFLRHAAALPRDRQRRPPRPVPAAGEVSRTSGRPPGVAWRRPGRRRPGAREAARRCERGCSSTSTATCSTRRTSRRWRTRCRSG